MYITVTSDNDDCWDAISLAFSWTTAYLYIGDYPPLYEIESPGDDCWEIHGPAYYPHTELIFFGQDILHISLSSSSGDCWEPSVGPFSTICGRLLTGTSFTGYPVYSGADNVHERGQQLWLNWFFIVIGFIGNGVGVEIAAAQLFSERASGSIGTARGLWVP